MIEKEETKKLILSYIKENAGTKHKSNKLSLNMAIPVATMRKLLNELLDASETKTIGLRPCLAIRLSHYEHTLNCILRRACLGKTTAKGLTHGA